MSFSAPPGDCGEANCGANDQFSVGCTLPLMMGMETADQYYFAPTPILPRWCMLAPSDRLLWQNYTPHVRAWDELFDRTGLPHEHCSGLADWLGQLAGADFQQRRQSADL